MPKLKDLVEDAPAFDILDPGAFAHFKGPAVSEGIRRWSEAYREAAAARSWDRALKGFNPDAP